MKITVSSDDGSVVNDIDLSDIDLTGHSLNKTVLMYRIETAISRVAEYEEATKAEGNRGPH